jgi:hypothetical protein
VAGGKQAVGVLRTFIGTCVGQQSVATCQFRRDGMGLMDGPDDYKVVVCSDTAYGPSVAVKCYKCAADLVATPHSAGFADKFVCVGCVDTCMREAGGEYRFRESLENLLAEFDAREMRGQKVPKELRAAVKDAIENGPEVIPIEMMVDMDVSFKEIFGDE